MADERKPTFGKYNVLDMLGEGGMGRVWRGFDPDLEVPVAIKELKEQFRDKNNLERFYREAQIAAKCRHQNIVLITDLSKDPPYFVMEFLEAKELSVYVHKGKPVSLGRIVKILSQVCDGLGFLHGRGIYHRDLKPANVMLLQDDTVKITDFGISKAPFGQATMTQVIMGTIPYMSPEQITTPGQIDQRVDVWAMGVILFELTQRRHPFPGEGDINTIFHIVHSPPAEFGPMPPPVEERLKALLTKALQKKPEERVKSTAEFKKLLKGLLQGVADPESIIFPYEPDAEAPVDATIAIPRPEGVQPTVLIEIRRKAEVVIEEIESLLARSETLIEAGLRTRSGDMARMARELIAQGDLIALDAVARDLESEKAAIDAAITKGVRRELALAEEYALDGQHDEAGKAYRRVLAAQPEHVEARRGLERALSAMLQVGRESLEGGDAAAAIQRAEAVLGVEPEHTGAFRLKQEAEDRRSALEEIAGLRARARELLAAQKPEEALSRVQELLERAPGDREGLEIRAEAEKSIELATRARHAEAVRAEGRRLLEGEEYEKAKISFSTLLDLLPGDAEATEALKAIEQALAEAERRRHEEDERLRREAGERRRHEEGMKRASEAARHLQAGEFEQAIRSYEEAARLIPEEESVKEGIEKARRRLDALRGAEQEALAREKAGDIADAVRLWKQILALQASHARAGAEIQRLEDLIRQEKERRRAEEEAQRRRAEEERRRKAEEDRRVKAAEEAKRRKEAESAFQKIASAAAEVRGVPREDHALIGQPLMSGALESLSGIDAARQKGDAEGIRSREKEIREAAERIREQRNVLLAKEAARIEEAATQLEETLREHESSLKQATVRSAREALGRAKKDAGGPALHPLAAHVESLRRARDGILREVQEAVRSLRSEVQKARTAFDAVATKNRRAVGKRPDLLKRFDALKKQASPAPGEESVEKLQRLVKDLEAARSSVPLDPLRFLPHAIAAAGVILAVAGFLTYRFIQAHTRHAYDLHVVPWGEIVSIQSEAGEEIEPPPGASPFHELRLVPGTYTVTVENPATGSRESVTVTIPDDISGKVELEGPDFRRGLRQLLEQDPFFEPSQ